jgi:hypothetical protein
LVNEPSPSAAHWLKMRTSPNIPNIPNIGLGTNSLPKIESRGIVVGFPNIGAPLSRSARPERVQVNDTTPRRTGKKLCQNQD